MRRRGTGGGREDGVGEVVVVVEGEVDGQRSGQRLEDIRCILSMV